MLELQDGAFGNISVGKEQASAELSHSARVVLEKRYLKKNEKGLVVETPEDMFWRVAENIASIERNYGKSNEEVDDITGKFYRMMVRFEFLPNSPTLMNAGRDLQQLSACFVLPIEDSMESIFEAIKQTALIHKSGGGTGFSFTALRPASDPVASTGGVASGPISFMKVFNATTDVVKQGGTRRGANMGILNIDHPDILEFITAKDERGALTNFNLSVALTEEFMTAVEEGKSYPLVNPRSGKTVRKLKAKDVFDLIVEMAWRSGEPGVIFIDRMNRDNPTPHIGRIESTNPCGEQPLLPYESCNLGSINLVKMVREGKGRPEIDYEKLSETVTNAVRFLDNVIDANCYPIKKIAELTRGNRKIGLGVMGFADLLIHLGISYNSEEALAMADNVMKFIKDKAVEASEKLAGERGVFANWEGSFFDAAGGRRIRNATLTTIAPTGSISIISNCSSGIEPVFALSYVREILDGEKLIEVHPHFEERAKGEGFYSPELMTAIAKKGSIKDMEVIPKEVRELFVTSHDISPEWHVRMQAAFQKYTDNAVSKTVNFPIEATREQIKEVFIRAYREGCKGITVYRYGSRESQVLNIQDDAKKQVPVKKIASMLTEDRKILPRPRPSITTGTTEKIAIGCGNLYVTVNLDDLSICEVFTQTGKGGGCPSQSEAVGRLVSVALRSDIDPASIVNQLKGIRCVSCTRRGNVKVLSCPDAISRVMEKVMQLQQGSAKKGAKESPKEPVKDHGQGSAIPPRSLLIDEIPPDDDSSLPQFATCCPECSSPIEFVGRCYSCRSCGYSKCG
ncbi:MAG: vitamin B12-dependent ribonucleotide reductase [Candidatus Eremiobacteraeota bacterium]|nr:vitamin B12-dependent ribonucleotide reductase [Candidatus Eremiobacteraeota bacterium]